MDKLARLEAEADRRSTALASAASRFARRFSPLRLADEALGRWGPSGDIAARLSGVARRNPLAATAFALSAAVLAWQFLRSGNDLISVHPRNSVLTSRRRRISRRKLAPAEHIAPNEGVES